MISSALLASNRSPNDPQQDPLVYDAFQKFGFQIQKVESLPSVQYSRRPLSGADP